jgi:hypothetical protein
MTTRRVVTVLSLLLAACQQPSSSAQPAPSATIAPPASSPVPITPPPSLGSPVTCASDADCGRLACGPCKSGDVVLRQYTMVNCTVNPCPGTTSVCRSGVCVVR